jgi:hypothetical protein
LWSCIERFGKAQFHLFRALAGTGLNYRLRLKGIREVLAFDPSETIPPGTTAIDPIAAT